MKPTFSSISKYIIQPKCLSCHSGPTASKGIDLSSYGKVMSTGSVIAGKPDQSSFYTSTASGAMPMVFPRLSASEVKVISDWITAGAPDDSASPMPSPSPSPSPKVTPLPSPSPSPSPKVTPLPSPSPSPSPKVTPLPSPSPSPSPKVTPLPSPSPSPSPSPQPAGPAPTFSSISKNILQPKCLSCHSGSSPSKGVDLSSYAKVMATGSVVAGKPDSSSLYTTTASGAMPMLFARLSTSEVKAISDWITAGALDDSSPNPPPSPVPPSTVVSCESRNELLPPELRRLTEAQIKNSLSAIFGTSVDLTGLFELNEGYAQIGTSDKASLLAVTSINLVTFNASIDQVIKQLLASNTAVTSCSTQTTTTCITALLNQYGPLLWRRPLTSSETTAFNTQLGLMANDGANNSQKLTFVFKTLMLSPHFLYRSEVGTAVGSSYELTGYEIASILSYTIWDSTPDSALYAAAADGSLKTQAGIDTQVTRMLSDSRVNGALLAFYRDYLKLDNALTVSKDAMFNFTPAVRQAALDSALRTVSQKVSTLGADHMDVFRGNSFFVNKDLAPLFGISATGLSSSMVARTLPDSERAGILSHPAFIAAISGEVGTSIVKRGVFALEQLLCYELGGPPDGAKPVPPPPGFDPAKNTTREILRVTHSSQSACLSCHSKIDPAGAGFENLDPVGNFRLTEKAQLTIDSSGSIDLGTRILQFTNSPDYGRVLAESSEMRACVSLRFLEHAFGREIPKTSCEYGNYSTHVSNGQNTVSALLRSVSKLESLKKRKSN